MMLFEMARYRINKGVGRAVEVKGLRAQYFIYAVAGVVIAVVAFFALSFITGQVMALIISAALLFLNVSVCYYLNNRFGEKGLSHLWAQIYTPHRIAFHKRVYRTVLVKDED